MKREPSDEVRERFQDKLRNWGRWSRDDDGGPALKPPSVWKQYRAPKVFDSPEPVNTPIDALEALETERAITALGRVNPKRRALLIARYVHHASLQELAKLGKVSVPVAGRRLALAEDHFRELLVRGFSQSLPW